VYRSLQPDVEVRDPEILDVLRQVVTASMPLKVW
jgi:hypothetical protein